MSWFPPSTRHNVGRTVCLDVNDNTAELTGVNDNVLYGDDSMLMRFKRDMSFMLLLSPSVDVGLVYQVNPPILCSFKRAPLYSGAFYILIARLLLREGINEEIYEFLGLLMVTIWMLVVLLLDR